ncbi:uncharacterized protein LOC133111976 [Conger conger]|uniref:uncharacterized protein LOC133111976 n=1 Tax=Conger conger TaxID=82655 RepID=UPI002A5A6D42|nr:uncharacterized protein LOC133111976 [Conger conger]
MAEGSGSHFIRDLTGEKLMKAEEVRNAAVQILKDALEKGMYGLPVSFHYTCSEPVDSYKFCCIPGEAFLRDLLEKSQNVAFKEDVDPDYADVFAYVYPGSDTVYLCELFWEAPDDLCEDSKPGTFIHEVSHLLGTDDVLYDLMEVELYEDHGTLLGRSQRVEGLDGNVHYREEVAQINANSLEHEFETVLNHLEVYRGGKYACCGETKKHSVCRSRSTGHYYLYERFHYRATEMEGRLKEVSPAGMRRYAKIKNKACRVTCA